MATIFGRIIAGEIPCNKVYEDDMCLAFHDIAPVAPVHVLLIPKKEIASLDEAAEHDREILGHLMHKAAELGKQLAPKGFRVVINNGPDAGQSVDHLHLHILGGKPMGWPPF
jgi:histidine triad (HIT) family protein